MENLTDKLSEIIKEIEANPKTDQIKKFDDAMEKFSILDLPKKTDYSFPLIDTLGKRTYASLNKIKMSK